MLKTACASLAVWLCDLSYITQHPSSLSLKSLVRRCLGPSKRRSMARLILCVWGYT